MDSYFVAAVLGYFAASVKEENKHVAAIATDTTNSKELKTKEEEEEKGPPITWVPSEVLCIILSLLDAKTLMFVVPQVCKFWRSMCQELRDVHLEFRSIYQWKMIIPLEVFAGWQVLPTLQTEWVSGICALFPHTKSVTIDDCQGIGDEHIRELVNNLPGLTNFNLTYSKTVTDTAVFYLAEKCRGLTHATFFMCFNLTNAAVHVLANKCRKLKHVTFEGCSNLTDAAVFELAEKCPGLTYANFGDCLNLTDAAVVKLANKCSGLTFAYFGSCMHLTDVGLLALVDNCHRLTRVVFWRCGKLTDVVKAKVKEQHPKCRFGF